MVNIPGFQKHIIALHPSIERALIIPIGSYVIVPDVFGEPQFGRIESYGFSRCYEPSRKVYSVRGIDSLKLGYREYSEIEIIMVLGE